MQDLNRQTGASMDPDIDPSSQMQSNTRHLMSAVTRLPQLSERKRIIDKHTNILHALLAAIQGRTLDKFYTAEEACLLGKGDVGGVVNLLQVGSCCTPSQPLTGARAQNSPHGGAPPLQSSATCGFRCVAVLHCTEYCLSFCPEDPCRHQVQAQIKRHKSYKGGFHATRTARICSNLQATVALKSPARPADQQEHLCIHTSEHPLHETLRKPLSMLQTSRGTPTDALRLALVLLLTCEALPAATDLERLAQALQQRGADLAAFNYVRRMRSLNLTGKAAAQPGVDGLGGGSSSQSQLLTWADKAFGQGLNAVTKGGWVQEFEVRVDCCGLHLSSVGRTQQLRLFGGQGLDAISKGRWLHLSKVSEC